MKIRILKKSLVICIICIIIIISFPSINGDIDYFDDSFIFISGKCNSTICGSIWWKLGLYIPIVKRNFVITANNGTDESINIIVFSIKNGFGTYFNYKNINIEIHRARGFFYSGEKSVIINHTDPPQVFIICKAKSTYVTT